MTVTAVERGALSATLRRFVEGLEGRDTTLGEVAETIGDRGFGLLLLVLSLPAALPLPAPGYATPFGLAMALLAVQMVAGRTVPWLPQSLAARRLPNRLLQLGVGPASLPLRVVEWLVRPRLSGLARNTIFLRGLAVIVLGMSLLMALPVPLTNTAPSFVIFVLAAGILEEDGLVLLAGVLLAPVAGAIAAVALYFAFTLGLDAVEEHAKPFIKGLLGLE